MKKGLYAVPALALLAADIILAVRAWNPDEMNLTIFLAFHFALVLAAAALCLKRRKGREDGSGLPAYWRHYLDSRIPELQKRDMETGNHGDSFLFITDLHYDSNDGNSAAAAEYILDRTAVSKVIIGGDICNGSSKGKQVCVSQILNCRNAFRRINPYYLRGNHDNNTEITERSDEKTISDSELYGMILKPIEDRIVSGGKLHYYFDNTAQRIRYICLDTGHPDPCVIDDGQITWMQERIRELSAGWTVVVLAHQFYGTTGEMDGNGRKILAGLNAVRGEAEAAIACVVCGHSHADHMETTAQGFPVICTTCDTRGGAGTPLKRWAHTPSEQAFDVFHINTESRTIRITRIGAGTDRQATY